MHESELQAWARSSNPAPGRPPVKAQGPLRLHLSPMGCKWYAGLWMRAVSTPRAGPLLKDEFHPSFLTSWTQMRSNGFRGTEQWRSQKGCGFCSSKGMGYVCLQQCPRRGPSHRTSGKMVIYDSFSSRGRGVLLPSARPQSRGCVVQQGGFVKPGYPLCTRDAK